MTSRWTAKLPEIIKIVVCLYLTYGVSLIAWDQIKTAYLTDNRQAPLAINIELPLLLQDLSENLVSSGFMAGYITEHGETVSPVNLLLYLRIVNLQTIQTEITRYSVEVAPSQNGPWLSPLPLHDPDMYSTPNRNLTTAEVVQFGWIEDVLRITAIQPRERKSGWASFALPMPITPVEFFKFQITESSGVKTTLIVPRPKKQPVGTVEILDATFFKTGKYQDISKFYLVHYVDRNKPRRTSN